MELEDIKSHVLSLYRINSCGPTVLEEELDKGALCPYCGKKLNTYFNKEKNLWETSYCKNPKCSEQVSTEMRYNHLLADYEIQIKELRSRMNEVQTLLNNHIFKNGIMTEKTISSMENNAKTLRKELELLNQRID